MQSDRQQIELVVHDSDFEKDNGQPERQISILNAFAAKLLPECKNSPLGTSLIGELQRFIEVLEMYKPVAEFPI